MKTIKRKRLAGILGCLLALILTLGLVTPALAIPQIPHQFWGEVTIGGVQAEEGTLVSAKIGGVEYASTTVDAEGKYGYEPLFKVTADDTDTPEKEGGTNGETIEFYVTDVLATTFAFQIGGHNELDLSIADVEAPTATLSPEDGASGVAIDAAVTAAFDEDVTEVDLSGITIPDATGVSATLDEATDTITIAHDDFASLTSYTVTIPAGAVEDTAGNPSALYTWSFTTADVEAPTATLSPEDGASGVAIDAAVTAAFDEDVTEVDLSGITIPDATGVSATLDEATDTITIAHDDFASLTSYTVTIPAGAVEDTAGNPSALYTWSFTTAAVKGDFDGDGDIDLSDFVEFATAYGSSAGDPNYNVIGDFDDDGDIDLADFVEFATVYGYGT